MVVFFITAVIFLCIFIDRLCIHQQRIRQIIVRMEDTDYYITLICCVCVLNKVFI